MVVASCFLKAMSSKTLARVLGANLKLLLHLQKNYTSYSTITQQQTTKQQQTTTNLGATATTPTMASSNNVADNIYFSVLPPRGCKTRRSRGW